MIKSSKKLTADDETMIRQLYRMGFADEAIANGFNVSVARVHKVVAPDTMPDPGPPQYAPGTIPSTALLMTQQAVFDRLEAVEADRLWAAGVSLDRIASLADTSAYRVKKYLASVGVI